MKGFNVTYDLVTEASSREGDTAKAGFLAKNVTLREALDLLTGTPCLASVEADNGSKVPDRWITAYSAGLGAYGYDHIPATIKRSPVISETRSLHIPETVGRSSRQRIMRVAKFYE